MPKLHELLAIEGPLKSQADKTRADLISTTFEKKRHLFQEKVETFTPVADGAPAVTESQLSLQTTVHHELEWISGIWSKALDAAFSIAEANTSARADVVLEDGKTVILKNVPATALLELEKRASEIQQLVAAIPTLDPAKGFVPDPDKGSNIYKAREDVRKRTQKTQIPLVLYAATKEHPAQVKEISVDLPVGTLQTQEWSGLITPAEKADMLDRAEQLGRALKAARSRANSIDVPTLNGNSAVGNTLLSYVFGNGRKAGQAKG